MSTLYNIGRDWLGKSVAIYRRLERYLPILSFLAGFGWDSLTLNRVDRLSDNLILLAYLVLLGASIILFNLVDKKVLRRGFFVRHQRWYPVSIQFFSGGLFSAYIVFYFQSAGVGKGYLFLGLLMGLMLATELLKERLTNIYLQTTFFFLAAFSFFVFFLPVMLKRMGAGIFLISGLISLLLILGILLGLQRQAALKSREEFRRLCLLVALIFLLLNGFYRANWIPPIPLSLKYGGVFHHLTREEDRYRLQFEKPAWYQIFKNSDDPFHFAGGDTVYCFASVFAPTALTTRIYHHWQRFSEEKQSWQSTDRISYPISGGRDGGYRGFTYKRNLQSGDWRIIVESEDRRSLGKISFRLQEVSMSPRQWQTIYR